MIYNEQLYFERLSRKAKVVQTDCGLSLVTDIAKLRTFEEEHPDLPLGMIRNQDGNKHYYDFCMDVYFNKKSGSFFRYCSVEYPYSGAAVLAVFSLSGKRYYLLNRQYRPFLGKTVLEIPRGFSETGDSAFRTAAKELREESGLDISEGIIKSLGFVSSDSGLTNNMTELFLVEYITEKQTVPSEAEMIFEQKLVPEAALYRMIAEGELSDGFTLAALVKFMAKNAEITDD